MTPSFYWSSYYLLFSSFFRISSTILIYVQSLGTLHFSAHWYNFSSMYLVQATYQLLFQLKYTKLLPNIAQKYNLIALLYFSFIGFEIELICSFLCHSFQKMLYSVWMTTADLWDSIMEKRIDLLHLRLKLKLYSVLNNQVMPIFS